MTAAAEAGLDPRVVADVDGWLAEHDEVPAPGEVAEVLVDSECAAGLYEGCSSALEMAYADYSAQAARYLGGAAVSGLQVVLEVDLGNEGMSTPSDVSNALQRSLARAACGLFEPLGLGNEGRVLDGNGNTVGSWQVVPS